MEAISVDRTLNPLVAGVKPSKTMALTDLATSMKEKGIDVSAFYTCLSIQDWIYLLHAQVIGLAAGEPDFNTPAQIVAAGIEALQSGITRYTPNTGTTALRNAICKKLKGAGMSALSQLPSNLTAPPLR
jgi:aspartate/glutamate/aspartate-prephenate aminotransferase